MVTLLSVRLSSSFIIIVTDVVIIFIIITVVVVIFIIITVVVVIFIIITVVIYYVTFFICCGHELSNFFIWSI